eukprot:12888051-Prorocentrum_lima.AAC.1
MDILRSWLTRPEVRLRADEQARPHPVHVGSYRQHVGTPPDTGSRNSAVSNQASRVYPADPLLPSL